MYVHCISVLFLFGGGVDCTAVDEWAELCSVEL